MRVKKRESLIDLETGELIHEYEKNLDMYTFTDKGFILFNSQPKVRLYPKFHWNLEDHEAIKLFRLAPYLSRANVICSKDRPLDANGIGAAIGITSVSRIYAFLRRMKEKGIIKQDNHAYVVNPMYLNASNRIDGTLYRLFQAELDGHLSPFTKKEARKRWPDDTPS